MDYESDQYEADLCLHNVVVITDKATGKCGSVCLKKNGRLATHRMLKADVDKYGAGKALSVWAKLVGNWS